MLTALFVMMAAMTLLFVVLLLMAMRNEILRRRVRTLELTGGGRSGVTHAGFIAAAYVVTAVGLAGLIAWIVADGRTQRRRLADLEARGIKRRSER